MEIGDSVVTTKDLAQKGEVDYVEKGSVGKIVGKDMPPFPYTVEFDHVVWLVNATEIEAVDNSTQG